ncbi:MAG: hypothetical protein L3J15_08750 [Devosiaceae bacterium]|nr:hypothetical protein [Devosiaceae bacterium]
MKNILSRLVIFIWLLVFTGGALAQNNNSFSEVLAKQGFSGAIDWLQTQPKTPENQFLLGGVEALSAIEFILQVRYDNYSGELPLVPGGRAQLQYNPDAVFDPAFIEIALKGALKRLEKASNVLDKTVGNDFSIEVDIADLWFDINKNGKRDENENFTSQLNELPAFANNENKSTIIRFDKADADWLAAYVHVLSGMAEMVLAVDPTPAIRTISEGRALMAEMGAIRGDPILGEDEMVDSIAVIVKTLDGIPDKKRTRAALAHFKKMISHNQDFWRLVMLEKDDENEWLPNPNQVSAFGMSVTLEMAEAWQAVLLEISDVLEGRVLIPHWRIGTGNASETGVGINFAKLMSDPGEFDIILMLHGAAIAPYLETGKVTNMRSWRSFSQLTGGQGMLFSLWFN